MTEEKEGAGTATSPIELVSDEDDAIFNQLERELDCNFGQNVGKLKNKSAPAT